MGTATVPGRSSPTTSPTRPARRADAALCGVAATAVALGVAELLAGLTIRGTGGSGTSSPLLAVGGAFVDATPAWLRDWAIEMFGTADKVALGVGMGITLFLLGGLVGWLGRRSRSLAVVLFILLGLVGVAAVASRPAGGIANLVPTVLGILVGLLVLVTFLGRLDRISMWAAPDAGGQNAVGPSRRIGDGGGELSRRGVLGSAVGLGALGAIGILAGQALVRTGRAVRDAVVTTFGLPVPMRTVQVPPGAVSALPGHTPFITPNADFYRIDTALMVPRVDIDTWRLRVTGLVEREIEMDLDELLAQEHVEAMVTLTCVSNEVGGSLVGNATWIGWPVRELLARAGVRPEADMVLSRSVDGFSAGTPLEVLTDERDALIAVGMNGEPLPPEHGFPVRMVVPGLYGYVSATKWLTELKVTRFDVDEGYWTPRGWSAHGPIKMASRIDVPRDGKRDLAAGSVTVAGVAWAQGRGISRVEVQVGDGGWNEADLLAEPTVDAWRLWTWQWSAQPGRHTITVRATDGEGRLQTDQVALPAPDGSSGWHSIHVRVR